MKLDFTNKTALITGSTRGIGKAIAECLSMAGANLLLTGTKFEEVEKLNAQNKDQGIFNIKYLQADFSNLESTNSFLDNLLKVNQIDVCINNAGTNKIGSFLDSPFEDFDHINEVNVNVPYKILKIVAPKMIENHYGRIVNVASIWSVITRPGRAMYTSSKTAIVGLTRTLAIEWAIHNIMVNAVSPGFTLTELTKATNSIEQLADIKNTIPAKRLAEPVEIAKVIMFLCSDQNTYLTGQNIIIDGGYTNV